MAQNSTTAELIDRSLHYNRAMMDELLEVTEEWDQIPDGELAGWTMDWHQFASEIIPEISEEYAAGLMTPDQERSYHQLIQRIEEHKDLIQRFNLTMPRVPVES